MKTLRTKTFPTPLSVVGLGTTGIGAVDIKGKPLEFDFSILDTYYELGGRLIDTANVYGRWGACHTNASEIVIGKWLAARGHDDVTVITKACHFAPESPDVSRVDEASLRYDIEESRTSLGLDMLPILLLHRDNENVDIRKIVDFCIPLVNEGKVLRFGFSNYTAKRVKDAIAYLGDDWNDYFLGVSNEWSLAMDGAVNYRPGTGMAATDDEMKALSVEYDFPNIPFSSIAHGFFSKLQACGVVYDGSWHNTEGFRGNRWWLTDKNGLAYNKLISLSEEHGISLTMLSLAYLLAQKNTIPLMSVSRPEQLAELLAVTEKAWDISMFL